MQDPLASLGSKRSRLAQIGVTFVNNEIVVDPALLNKETKSKKLQAASVGSHPMFDKEYQIDMRG